MAATTRPTEPDNTLEPLCGESLGTGNFHFDVANGCEPPHGGHSGAGHERHTAGSNLCYVDGHVQYLAADRFVCHARLPIWWQRPLIFPDAKTPEEEP
jgi:prepilin-type processing-associated H-X9-DG protein